MKWRSVVDLEKVNPLAGIQLFPFKEILCLISNLVNRFLWLMVRHSFPLRDRELSQLKAQVHRSMFGGEHVVREDSVPLCFQGVDWSAIVFLTFPLFFARFSQCLKIKFNIPEETMGLFYTRMLCPPSAAGICISNTTGLHTWRFVFNWSCLDLMTFKTAGWYRLWIVKGVAVKWWIKV